MYQPRSKAYSWTVSQHDTFLRWGVFSTSPKPQAGGPPLVGCPLRLIQYIRSYPPYWRPFLHLQPEDMPCALVAGTCLSRNHQTQLYKIIHSATCFDPIGSSSGCLQNILKEVYMSHYGSKISLLTIMLTVPVFLFTHSIFVIMINWQNYWNLF